MCNLTNYPKNRVSTPLNPRLLSGVEIVVGRAKPRSSWVERSRWHSLSVKRKPKPTRIYQVNCLLEIGVKVMYKEKPRTVADVSISDEPEVCALYIG